MMSQLISFLLTQLLIFFRVQIGQDDKIGWGVSKKNFYFKISALQITRNIPLFTIFLKPKTSSIACWVGSKNNTNKYDSYV